MSARPADMTIRSDRRCWRRNLLIPPNTLEEIPRDLARLVKNFFDRLGPPEKKSSLAGKIGGAFVAASRSRGGTEVVTMSLYPPVAQWGMIIVPAGNTDEAMLESRSPYGASAVVGAENRELRPGDLDAVQHQGRRTVTIAKALIPAGEIPNRNPG